MIELRNGLTIERRQRVNADLDGAKGVMGTIAPRLPQHEYVTVVLGTVPRNSRVSRADVMTALRHLVERER